MVAVEDLALGRLRKMTFSRTLSIEIDLKEENNVHFPLQFFSGVRGFQFICIVFQMFAKKKNRDIVFCTVRLPSTVANVEITVGFY